MDNTPIGNINFVKCYKDGRAIYREIDSIEPTQSTRYGRVRNIPKLEPGESLRWTVDNEPLIVPGVVHGKMLCRIEFGEFGTCDCAIGTCIQVVK